MWPKLLGDIVAPRTMVGLHSIAALCSPLKEGLDLGKDSFARPHITCSGEALFVVDDMAERAAGEVASQGREGVKATLAEMCDAIAVVACLGMEAQHQMDDEVAI